MSSPSVFTSQGPSAAPYIYYPSGMHSVPVTIEGSLTVASHDQFAAIPGPRHHFIDSAFLSTLLCGSEALASMGTAGLPAPLEGLSQAGVHMLGVPTLPLTAYLRQGGTAVLRLQLQGVCVVSSLPVPLHLSLHSAGYALSCLPTGFSTAPFEAASFPAPYRPHPYWRKDGPTFIASLGNLLASLGSPSAASASPGGLAGGSSSGEGSTHSTAGGGEEGTG